MKGGTGRLLSHEDREVFHSIVAKFQFISSRACPNIAPTVSFLGGRVQEGVTNQDNWGKCRHLVKYLDSTRDLHVILRYNGLRLARWYVDSSFAVHDDFRLQSGGAMKLSDTGRAITSGSNKQKLNTRGLTESDLVAADDFYRKFFGLENSWELKVLTSLPRCSTTINQLWSSKKGIDALWLSEAVLLMYNFLQLRTAWRKKT